MFLALVVTPGTRLTWEAFKAARGIASATGALLTAAGNAAVAGIVGQAGAAIGAGALGWFIGQSILESLEPDPLPEIPLALNYRVPDGSGRIRVEAFSKTKNNPPINFVNEFDAPLVGPVLRTVGPGIIVFGVLSGTPLVFTEYGGGGADLFDTYLEITSVTKLDGTAPAGLRKVPGPRPKIPAAPITTPTTIPVPGLPAFPITPTFVPNPDNDPDKDDENRAPGVVVQIPEYGLQFNFGLDGVKIDRYKSPATAPFEFPKIPAPPGTGTPSKDPCPCPEVENKDEEILCRILTLQTKLLDDGFTLDLRTQGPAQCLSATGFNKEFRYLEISATSIPDNAKRISYPAPGVDSVFIGNIQFEVKGALTGPIPIRTTNQIEVAPIGATGYVVSGAFGFEMVVNAYLYTPKPFIDFC